MLKTKIKWFNKSEQEFKRNIAQIYSKGLEFALTTASEQRSCFVYCKDFLHDAIWSILNNKAIDVYSFLYDPAKQSVDVNDLTRVLIGNESDKFLCRKIPNCVDLLNQVEAILHLRRTVAYECEDPPENYQPGGVFMLESSQRWMTAPPMLSMYSTLIRCGFVHQIGDGFMTTFDKILSGEVPPYQENDVEFLANSMSGIKAILFLGYRKIFYKDLKKNYPSKLGVMTVHNDCGIRAYSWGKTKNLINHWHREKLLTDLKQDGLEIPYLWSVPPVIKKHVKTELTDSEKDKTEFAEEVAKVVTTYKKTKWEWE